MVVPEPGELVGRQAERQRLRDFIRSLDAGPAAAVIRGEAGVGKTVLWRDVVDAAGAAGARALQSRCVEVEMPIAFGALADLLDDAMDEIAARLTVPQRRALEISLGREDDREMRPDWLALARAVLATLSVLAEQSPLLVAVDDVQWLDPASRRALGYAVRRLPAVPVGVLTTLRSGSADCDPLALSDFLRPEQLVQVNLSGLSAGAIQHLVHARLDRHLPRPTLARIQRASGGNPMFALELARMLAAEGSASAVPLEVPPSLTELVRKRASAFPPEITPLLELAAAIERPTLALAGRCLGGIDRAAELLDAAVRAEALALADDGVIRFTHPLLASAIYFGIPLARRRGLHRALADEVDGIEARARHAALATQGADAATADLVERASESAAARGALDAAAALAAEAARLTPPEREADRYRRVLGGAAHLADSGEFAAARDRVEPLLDPSLPTAVRAQALLLRADTEIADRQRLVELLWEALAAAADEPSLRWQALFRLAQHAGWVSGDTGLAAELAREALEVATDLDEARLAEASAAALAFYEVARGTGEDVAPSTPASRCTPLPRLPWWMLSPRLSSGCRAIWAGELEQARSALTAEYEELTRTGREARAGFALTWLSELEWRAGRWSEADEHAREATARLGDVNPTAYPRLLISVSAGRADEAREIAAGVLAYCEKARDRVSARGSRWALGLLELSRGDPERAWVELSLAQELLDEDGIREPGCVPLGPDVVECLAALGRLEEAEQAASRLAAAGVEHRWARPAARRARALVLLGQGDAREAAAAAAEAAAGFAQSGFALDRGRSLLVAGEARRRLGERRIAAEQLTAAARIFAELGAPLWLERAQRELRRASPRPSGDRGRLTAAESRVAALVAAGRTNREVAAELYTSVATVEAHLTRIYRKVGIRSRSELAHRVAAGSLVLDG